LLKQRNALLKHRYNHKVLEALDQEFIRQSEKLDAIRKEYLLELEPYVQSYADRVLIEKASVAIEYHSGWKAPLAQQIIADAPRDQRFKRTHSGPHRADIKITFNQVDARHNASRGQQKLIVVVLTLGQIQHFKDHTHTSGILMIDDLPSELDKNHQNLFVAALKELNQQTLITAIDPSSLDFSNWHDTKMFHVKHGRFSEVV
jgi:DNA replication and repair protein RecF